MRISCAISALSTHSLSPTLVLLFVASVSLPQTVHGAPAEMNWSDEASLLESLRQKSERDLVQLDEATYESLMAEVRRTATVQGGRGIIIAALGGISSYFMLARLTSLKSGTDLFRGVLAGVSVVITAAGIFLLLDAVTEYNERHMSLVDLRNVVAEKVADDVVKLHKKLVSLDSRLSTAHLRIALSEENSRILFPHQLVQDPERMLTTTLYVTLPGEESSIEVAGFLTHQDLQKAPPHGNKIILGRGVHDVFKDTYVPVPLMVEILSEGPVLELRVKGQKFRQLIKNKVVEAIFQSPISRDEARTEVLDDLFLLEKIYRLNVQIPEIRISRYPDPRKSDDVIHLNYTMSIGEIFHQAETCHTHWTDFFRQGLIINWFTVGDVPYEE